MGSTSGTIARPELVGRPFLNSDIQRMNKTELVEHLASKHDLSKAEAGRILETLLDAIVTTVKKGGAVTLPGFGSFKQHARAARNGVNPSTGAKIKIAAAKLPKFAPGAGFKAAVDPKAAARKAAKAPAPKAAPKKAAKKK
jgi:DNA-binding protein HU-beta